MAAAQATIPDQQATIERQGRVILKLQAKLGERERELSDLQTTHPNIMQVIEREELPMLDRGILLGSMLFM